MTSPDEALALAFEAGLPYAGLRGHVHDPGLDRLVPPDVARQLRVVPLAVRGDTLYLASAGAEPDLAPLAPTLGRHRVALAIAAGEEVDDVLGPAPVAMAEPQPAPEAERDRVASAEPEPAAAAEPAPRRPAVRPVFALLLLAALAAAAVVLVLSRTDSGNAGTTASRGAAAPVAGPGAGSTVPAPRVGSTTSAATPGATAPPTTSATSVPATGPSLTTPPPGAANRRVPTAFALAPGTTSASTVMPQVPIETLLPHVPVAQSSGRLPALAEVCVGNAAAAIVTVAPSKAELRACPALRIAGQAVDGAIILLRRGGGCISRTAALRAATNPSRLDTGRQNARDKAGFDRRERLHVAAVRDPAGHCVAPDPATVRSGAYPLTHSLVLVAAKATAAQRPVRQTAAALARTRPQVRTVVGGSAG